MSMTITDFLLARIAEDEAAAKAAAAHGRWPSGDWWAEGSWWLEGVEMLCVGKGSTGADVIAYAYAEPERAHIARHDPARVLAECEAKRRIVELFPDAAQDGDGWNDAGYSVLRDLAAVYADHPDYREEWRL